MRRFLILIFVLFTTSISGYSQFEISGVILDASGNQPVNNASVIVDHSSNGSTSDSGGKFNISGLLAGEYTLIISCMNYDKKIVIVVLNDKNVDLNILLKPSVISLSKVEINGGTMSGRGTRINEIPGSVDYISAKELERFNNTDINRALRSIPGVNIQEEDGFGLRPNIGLRGTGVERSSKITMMEDGILMAPAPYAAPAAYYFPTIGRMSGIEILKGASQIKYGPYTTGGAINLISTPIPTELQGKINLFGGNYGYNNVHAVVGNKHERISYSVETFQYKSDGFKTLENEDHTGFDKKDYLAKLKFTSKADAKIYQSISLKYGQNSEVSNETYLGLTQQDFDLDPYQRYAASQKDQMVADQRQMSASYVVGFGENVVLKSTIYQNNFKRNWYKLDKVVDSSGEDFSISALLDNPNAYEEALSILKGKTSENEDALWVKANNREYYSRGVQTAFIYNLEQDNLDHHLELGLRVHQDQMDRFQWVDKYSMQDGVMMLTEAGEHGTESNRIETANAIASYLNYQLKYKNWILTPGVRYEHIEIDRLDYGKEDPQREGVDISTRLNVMDVIIPGFGVSYMPTERINVFAGMHKGFAPAGSAEGALPEESLNYEIGTRIEASNFNGTMAVFFNDYQNLLGSNLAASGQSDITDFYNGGEAQSYGLELQGTYDLSLGHSDNYILPLTVTYTYTNATFQSTFESDFEGWGDVHKGDELPYYAPNQISADLAYISNTWGLNISSKYMDHMKTKAGASDASHATDTDAYFVLDMGINYAFDKNISLSLTAANITNETYIVARRPAGLRPGMPRSIRFGIKATL